MLNRYPLWKNLLIILFIALGALYALPNLYPDDLAVQVSGASSADQVDERTLGRIERALDKANLPYKSATLEGANALVRFTDSDDQLSANSVISKLLGDDYITALNLAPNTPAWLKSMGATPMKLGLDLRGGVHFLLEVDIKQAVSQRLNVYVSEIKTLLRSEKLRYRSVTLDNNGRLLIKFTNTQARDAARSLLADDYPEFVMTAADEDDAALLDIGLNDTNVREIEDYAINQNLTTLRNRVNEIGVAEPLIQRQGRNRIVVQLPGIQDTAAAKRILGSTANLEFRLEALSDASNFTTETFSFRSQPGRTAIVEKDIIITGDSVASAQSNFGETGTPQVNIDLNSQGGKLMNRITRNAVQRSMAVLYVENKSRQRVTTVDGETVIERIPFTEKRIISLATIQEPLGNRFRITGLDSAAESSELALLLRAGSLAAPIYFVEERTIGPSLGKQNIELGTTSLQIGLALVVIFMLVFYSVFGLVANLALGLNLMLVTAIMSLLGATLTLPGIAGIVLTVGMAVDANVLIFSRIKEELRQKVPIQSAIHSGYERAFITIFDANITTLLVAVILYGIGTGPVKGFAVTLSIGIVTSMFTAIFVSRALINIIYGRRQLNDIKIWPFLGGDRQASLTQRSK